MLRSMKIADISTIILVQIPPIHRIPRDRLKRHTRFCVQLEHPMFCYFYVC